jgi:hypothetical protein
MTSLLYLTNNVAGFVTDFVADVVADIAPRPIYSEERYGPIFVIAGVVILAAILIGIAYVIRQRKSKDL